MDNLIYFHPETAKQAQSINTKAARTSRTAKLLAKKLCHSFQQLPANTAEFLINEFLSCRRWLFRTIYVCSKEGLRDSQSAGKRRCVQFGEQPEYAANGICLFRRKESRKFQPLVQIVKPHAIAINAAVLQLFSRSLPQRFVISDEFTPDSAIFQFDTNGILFDPKPFYIFFRNFAHPFVPCRFFLSARAVKLLEAKPLYFPKSKNAAGSVPKILPSFTAILRETVLRPFSIAHRFCT